MKLWFNITKIIRAAAGIKIHPTKNKWKPKQELKYTNTKLQIHDNVKQYVFHFTYTSILNKY